MAASSQKQATDSPITSAASSASSSTSLSPPPGAAPAPVPTQRKSRVLSRKTDHSVIERRRREKINERLIRLQSLIPACREEAQEVLSAKPPKAARGKGVSQEVKAREIERCLAQEMVLEKLCIISHAVDYILELQTQVAAYRKLCLCDPPVREEVQPRDHRLHVEYAHEGVAQRASEGEEGTGSGSEREISPPAPAGGTTVGSASLASPTTVPGAFKRKRHWGSNKIPTAPASVQPSAKRSQADGSQRTSKPAVSRSPTYEAEVSQPNADTDDGDDSDESEEESHEAVTEPEPEADDDGYLAFSTDSVGDSSSNSLKSRRSSDPIAVAASFPYDRRPSLLSTGPYHQQQQYFPAPPSNLQSTPTGRARVRLQRVPGILGLVPDDRQWPRAYSRNGRATVAQAQQEGWGAPPSTGASTRALLEPSRGTEMLGMNVFVSAVGQEQGQGQEQGRGQE